MMDGQNVGSSGFMGLSLKCFYLFPYVFYSVTYSVLLSPFFFFFIFIYALGLFSVYVTGDWIFMSFGFSSIW